MEKSMYCIAANWRNKLGFFIFHQNSPSYAITVVMLIQLFAVQYENENCVITVRVFVCWCNSIKMSMDLPIGESAYEKMCRDCSYTSLCNQYTYLNMQCANTNTHIYCTQYTRMYARARGSTNRLKCFLIERHCAHTPIASIFSWIFFCPDFPIFSLFSFILPFSIVYPRMCVKAYGYGCRDVWNVHTRFISFHNTINTYTRTPHMSRVWQCVRVLIWKSVFGPPYTERSEKRAIQIFKVLTSEHTSWETCIFILFLEEVLFCFSIELSNRGC